VILRSLPRATEGRKDRSGEQESTTAPASPLRSVVGKSCSPAVTCSPVQVVKPAPAARPTFYRLSYAVKDTTALPFLLDRAITRRYTQRGTNCGPEESVMERNRRSGW
jgi:hypothetical protein